MCISFVPLLLPALQHHVFPHSRISAVFSSSPHRAPAWTPFSEWRCCVSAMEGAARHTSMPSDYRSPRASAAATRPDGSFFLKHSGWAALALQLLLMLGRLSSLSSEQRDFDKVFSSCCWIVHIQCLVSLQPWLKGPLAHFSLCKAVGSL